MSSTQYLQLFSGLCWSLVVLRLARSTWRCLFGQPHYLDPLLSSFFFVGLLQAGFVMRWMMYPRAITGMAASELSLWTALYALCGLLALWVLIVAGAYRDKQF